VQARAEHEVAGEQRFRAGEDVADFLLNGIHVPSGCGKRAAKTKSFFRDRSFFRAPDPGRTREIGPFCRTGIAFHPDFLVSHGQYPIGFP
jgi:hypothetical protein